MKCYRSASALTLAALAVLGLAGPVAAQVPFKGAFGGVVTQTPVDAQTNFVLVTATGNGTHLGKFALSVPHLVNVMNKSAGGDYQFTAANGDTLTAKFSGQANPTMTPGVLYIVETATITGGTGRFARATGSFVTERLYDRNAGTTIGSFAGTITPR